MRHLVWFFLGLACLSKAALAAEPSQLAKALKTVCENPTARPSELHALLGRQIYIHESGPQRRVTYQEPSGASVSVVLSLFNGTVRRASLSYLKPIGDALHPVLAVQAGPSCAVTNGRRIERDARGSAQWLVHLDQTLADTDRREPLNPPVPAGTDPGGVTVAHIDSGVNYTLPQIAERLARTADGDAVGYDYWDMDKRPFDVDAARSPFYPLRHGTLVSSILVREAPDIRLIAYRYPRPDMSRMAEVLAHASKNGAKIVAMPLGSNTRANWAVFKDAAARHAEMLFVVSAGNNGRNIDEAPVYPAVFDLENLLVVTSSTISGRLAPGSNWGPDSVDLMVPAERVEVTDHRGARGFASGSSYAVPRVAALAARLSAQNPGWTAAQVKAAIKDLAAPGLDRTGPKVRWGWIPNPADDG
ncbi:MAG: S8 family serine peptidase [Pseudomonadota bacterium]